jgi:hypothetical protein
VDHLSLPRERRPRGSLLSANQPTLPQGLIKPSPPERESTKKRKTQAYFHLASYNNPPFREVLQLHSLYKVRMFFLNMAGALLNSTQIAATAGGSLAVCWSINRGLLRLLFPPSTNKRPRDPEERTPEIFAWVLTGLPALLTPILWANARTDLLSQRLADMSYCGLQFQALSIVAGTMLGAIAARQTIAHAMACDKHALLADIRILWSEVCCTPPACATLPRLPAEHLLDEFTAGEDTPSEATSDSTWSMAD